MRTRSRSAGYRSEGIDVDIDASTQTLFRTTHFNFAVENDATTREISFQMSLHHVAQGCFISRPQTSVGRVPQVLYCRSLTAENSSESIERLNDDIEEIGSRLNNHGRG